MIDVINKISVKDTIVNSSTIKFMKNCKLDECPEDVYFSKNIQEFKLGKVADWESAFMFSSECIFNPNSFGGHNFFKYDWKPLVYKILT